ncbi:MAG: hypothetical protein IKE14_06385 [Loktanella sp.]|nr:hypothetical protein [Loktanella sp.]
MTRRAIVLTILAAVVALGLVKLVLPIVQDALNTGDGAVIRAEVRLINQCPLADSSFAVRNTDTGRSIPFSNGMARIEGASGTYLQIVLASRFDGVTFSGEKQRIKAQMTMTADCNSGERMRGVMDGIGDKFGN